MAKHEVMCKKGDTACLVRYFVSVSTKTLMTTENCFRRSGDGTYSRTYQRGVIPEEVNSHLKCIVPETRRMLLNLLNYMMDVNRHINGQYTCSYGPRYMQISKYAFFAGISTPTCRHVTLRYDVYVKDTWITVMEKTFACHNF